MVFFTCQHCGESLKKAVVEKHYYHTCKKFPFLTCVDCLKDFKGMEYKVHTSCVTEEERYSAKGFVPKPSSNKQQVKQMQWIDVIKEVLKSEELIPRHRHLLNICSSHTNVPRKLQKFNNFVNHIIKTDQNTIKEVHNLLQEKFTHFLKLKEEIGPSQPLKQGGVNGNKDVEIEQEKEKPSKNDSNSRQEKGDCEEENRDEKPLKKKELKKKRKQEKYLTELNSIEFNNEQKSYLEVDKRKKRKKEIIDEMNKEISEDVQKKSDVSSKKKRKRHEEQHEETSAPKLKYRKKDHPSVPASVTDTQEQDEDSQAKPKKTFKWNNVIIGILKTQEDGEMSFKKLRRKVINEYWIQTKKEYKTYEQLSSKFNKKIYKTVGVRVHKTKATLC